MLASVDVLNSCSSNGWHCAHAQTYKWITPQCFKWPKGWTHMFMFQLIKYGNLLTQQHLRVEPLLSDITMNRGLGIMSESCRRKNWQHFQRAFAYHCEHFESLKIMLSLKLFLHYDGKKQHFSPLELGLVGAGLLWLLGVKLGFGRWRKP